MRTIDCNEVLQRALDNPEGLVFESERRFDHQVEVLASRIFEVKDISLIMIAGPSSSGKTTFSRKLQGKLQELGVKVHYIGLDDFFIDRDKVPLLPSGLKDFDSPEAMDLPFLHRVLEGVINNEWVEVPTYNFLTGRREEELRLLRLHSQDVVVVEGIHALNPLLLKGLDTSKVCRVGICPRRTFVFPSGVELAPDDLRLLRRTLRDYYTRGYSFAETAKQWAEVCAAEDKYITPYLPTADYDVDSAFDYELFVYKHCLRDDLESCDLPAFTNLKLALREVQDLPRIHIPTGSLLNEFAQGLED